MYLEEELQSLQPSLPVEHRRPNLRPKGIVAVAFGFAAAAIYAYFFTPTRLVHHVGTPEFHAFQSLVERVPAAAAPVATLAPLKAAPVVALAPAVVAPVAAEIPQTRIIEGSLSGFVDTRACRTIYGGLRAGASSTSASASTIFDGTVEAARIASELTLEELSAFKYRFISTILDAQSSNTGFATAEDFCAQVEKYIEGTRPVMTQALADSINNRQSDFEVSMAPWLLDESVDSFNARLIKVPYQIAPEMRWKQHTGSISGRWQPGGIVEQWQPISNSLSAPSGENSEGLIRLPSQFFSSLQWPKCKEIIGRTSNQGGCGSCWVFAATGALDSRLCIATGGKFSGATASLSRGFGVSCSVDYNGCLGGWPHYIYDYIEKSTGLPSTNCAPYFGGSDYASHWDSAMAPPTCANASAACDPRFPRLISRDMFKPVGISNYRVVEQPNEVGMTQLMTAIYKEGPCPYSFNANEEFMGYTKGVFSSGCDIWPTHVVQAIGWGQEKKNGAKYILSLNSWGPLWGLNGTFKVAHCVVWNFVIPGSINRAQIFPLPVPAWVR